MSGVVKSVTGGLGSLFKTGLSMDPLGQKIVGAFTGSRQDTTGTPVAGTGDQTQYDPNAGDRTAEWSRKQSQLAALSAASGTSATGGDTDLLGQTDASGPKRRSASRSLLG